MYSRETPALPPAAHAQGPPAPQCGAPAAAPLALLLVLRPCFTHQAALERLQSRFHFGPVDAAQWYPEEAIYALRYDRWYAVYSLERQPFSSGTPGGPMPGD